ncbi:DUF4270 domain-containing protein [uncultured Pontibacter sp.]|uniref:DUF4270 domain-containing protein n=1 Tax=uncultured Pontibacter sp. TaxID=453356 RepID=UPI002615347F|nr:DUF4270 domain-containing protein [uncultured Pontibacter sp.]
MNSANSAARRLFLFFFSFAALTACEDPKDIGIDLQDENLIGTEFTDDLTIQTGTVLQGDSILSYRTSTALVGQYADPVLGITRSVAFAEVGLNGTNVSLGENITADSLVLTLDYSFKYADTLQAMQLNVHRATSAFDERTSYFTNTPFTYDPTPIGTAAFQPRVEMVTKEGTSTKTTRLAKIKLNSELANDFAAQSGQPAFANQANFLNYFRGIALAVPEDENGSLVGFALNSASSSLVLYYKKGDGTQGTHSFLLGTGGYFSQITTNRAGTGIEELQNKGDFKAATETGGDSYVQGGTQLLTKITFPDLLQLKEEQGNIIINRAELIIPVKAASTGNNLSVPPQLALYETNDANNILRDQGGRFRTVQQDGANPFVYTPALLGFNRKKGKEYYNLNVTSYIQGIVMGLKPNNGLLLGAVIATTDGNGNRSLRPEMHPYRAIVTNNEANPVKLLIYYSKLQ